MRGGPLRPARMSIVRAVRPSGSSVTSSAGTSSSIRLGGNSQKPCDSNVRPRSTGSPPAPTSSRSADHVPATLGPNVPALRRVPRFAHPRYFRAMAILGVDVGGTFTDAVLLTNEGELRTAKVPTAGNQAESVLAAAAEAGAVDVERFAHGTTVATNALLERKGARTAVVSTEGFEHLLHLRRQNRADLYRLCVDHAEPLVPLERCFGLRERIGPEGGIAPPGVGRG